MLCDAPYGGVHPPEPFLHGAAGPESLIPLAKSREFALAECHHVGGGGLRGPPHCQCGRGRQSRGLGGAPLAPERGVAVQRPCQKGKFRRVAAATAAGRDADVAPRAVAATPRPIAPELRPRWRWRRRQHLTRAAGAHATECRESAPCEIWRRRLQPRAPPASAHQMRAAGAAPARQALHKKANRGRGKSAKALRKAPTERSLPRGTAPHAPLGLIKAKPGTRSAARESETTPAAQAHAACLGTRQGARGHI